MTRLRRLALPLAAAVCLAGLPACGDSDVEREAKKAGNKTEKAAKKAEREAKKAKKDVDGQ
jgi:hypothetical protein